MLINKEFLNKLELSFREFLNSGSRSNKKLKIIHGFLKKKLKEKLGKNYEINSLDEKNGKEEKILGKYYPKTVDISIKKIEEKKVVGAISLKFVMQNYLQNSNNYFENLLGETVNIRTKFITYFHIFITFKNLPYFTNAKKIKKYETIEGNKLNKYLILSESNPEKYFHTPNKTLLIILEKVKFNKKIKDEESFINFYKNNPELKYVNNKELKLNFKSTVIYNDLSKFINEVYHSILSL